MDRSGVAADDNVHVVCEWVKRARGDMPLDVLKAIILRMDETPMRLRHKVRRRDTVDADGNVVGYTKSTDYPAEVFTIEVVEWVITNRWDRRSRCPGTGHRSV